MKIIVVLKDGVQEMLDLPNGSQWTVSDDPDRMDRLHGAHGFDHFFTT